MKNLASLTQIKKALVVLLTIACVYSCKKDSGVKPAAVTKASQVAFSLKAVNTSTALMASASKLNVNSVAPVIMFSSGTANITRFRLEAKTAQSSIEITTRNLMAVDLFALNPSVVTAALDTGIYKEIEVRVDFTRMADTSAIPLKLKGSFTAADGTITPVELDINQDLTIKAEASNVMLHNTGDISTLVQLHLDKMVAGITASDLSSASLTGGVIVISDNSNANLFNKIRLNVENCGDTQMHQEGGDDGGSHGEGGHGNDGSGHN